MSNIINLENYRAVDSTGYKSKVFTGRDSGRVVKEKSQLNKLIEENDIVEIIIPKDIYSINPSFLEEMLQDVIRKLGKEGFYDRIIFKNLGEYPYQRALEEAINRVLRPKTAIG